MYNDHNSLEPHGFNASNLRLFTAGSPDSVKEYDTSGFTLAFL
jgi:hypothetical protein